MFMSIVERMVEDFGKSNDDILFLPQMSILGDPEFRHQLKI